MAKAGLFPSRWSAERPLQSHSNSPHEVLASTYAASTCRYRASYSKDRLLRLFRTRDCTFNRRSGNRSSNGCSSRLTNAFKDEQDEVLPAASTPRYPRYPLSITILRLLCQNVCFIPLFTPWPCGTAVRESGGGILLHRLADDAPALSRPDGSIMLSYSL